MGITGANYAVADTGTLGIATNEGNARLVTTLPKVHVPWWASTSWCQRSPMP